MFQAKKNTQKSEKYWEIKIQYKSNGEYNQYSEFSFDTHKEALQAFKDIMKQKEELNFIGIPDRFFAESYAVYAVSLNESYRWIKEEE